MTIRQALQAEWDEFMRPTYVNSSGQTKRTVAENWRKANPGEWQKLQTYRASGGSAPTLATSIGKQMVKHVTAWRMTAPQSFAAPAALAGYDAIVSIPGQLTAAGDGGWYGEAFHLRAG